MYDASYVLKDCKGRVIPDGFSDQFDSTIWNVGFVFRYSEVFDTCLDCGVSLSVKPNMTIADAFADRMEEPMSDDYAVFFATGE